MFYQYPRIIRNNKELYGLFSSTKLLVQLKVQGSSGQGMLSGEMKENY